MLVARRRLSPDDSYLIFISKHECNVANRAEPPAKFTPRQEVRIDRDLYDRMVTYARETA
jgi:hypothetical protein